MQGPGQEEGGRLVATTSGGQSRSHVGARVKAFRAARRLTLRQLGEMTGMTASFISQLERGLSGASTSTLMRIANALGISLSDLFEERPRPVHRVLSREARPALPVIEGCRKMLLSQRPLYEIEVYAGEFEPGGSTGPEPYVHGDSHEMFLVIRGEIELTLGRDLFILRSGDSIEYASSEPHKAVNIGQTMAEVLWIISPPTSGALDLNRYTTRESLAPGTEEAEASECQS